MARKGNWTTLGKEKVESSGLTVAVAEQLGMYEIASAALLDSSFEARPALVIPYFDFEHKPLSAQKRWPAFYRVRYLDKPPADFKAVAGEKPSRYVQPPRSGVCAYFPTLMDWKKIAADPETELVITEGELKAAAATFFDFPTIGLGGVWNYRATKEGRFFLPELELIDWCRRTVFICYDSDYATNTGICLAINGIAEELEERGALVRVMMLPDVYEDKKTGLDDFFLERTNDDFIAVTRESMPLGVSRTLWAMNREVVYVENPGLIVVQENNQKLPVDAFKSHSRWATESTVEIKMSPKGVPLAEKVAAAPMWIRWPLRQSVKELTYAPGKEQIIDNAFYNQWPGWGVQPVKGEVTPWLELTQFILGGISKDDREWFYDWCAYPIQNPGTKMFTAVVIHGTTQGTGKTFVGYTLGEIYGKNYKEIEDDDLEESYWAENKQFILGDEVSGKDNRQYQNTLKRLITKATIDINIKFVPQYTLPNCMNFMFTSQHGDSFFIEDKDRRYFVVEVEEEEPLPEVFYKNYEDWLWRKGGASHLMHWLLERKIDRKFNPSAPARRTAAKERMILATKGDLGTWVHELMNFPDQILRIGQMIETRDLFSSKELLNLYSNEHPNTKVTAVGLGRKLAEGGCVQVDDGRPIRGADGKMSRYFAVKNIAKWRKSKDRKAMEANIKMPPVRK